MVLVAGIVHRLIGDIVDHPTFTFGHIGAVLLFNGVLNKPAFLLKDSLANAIVDNVALGLDNVFAFFFRLALIRRLANLLLQGLALTLVPVVGLFDRLFVRLLQVTRLT